MIRGSIYALASALFRFDTSKIVNGCEIKIIALKRNGHHAIINWILSQTSGEKCFLNYCEPVTNPFLSCNEITPCNNKMNDLFRIRMRFKRKDYMLYGYENRCLKDLKSRVFEQKHDEWVGKSGKTFNVFILRDAFNMFASFLK